MTNRIVDNLDLPLSDLYSSSSSLSPSFIKLKSPRDILFDNVRIRTPLAQIILDTLPMQRCRFINQLQVSPFVYPSAVHTRFEHQLSVYHCTNLWLDDLFTSQPELSQDCDERHRELIGIAALLHDSGHLANSHNFDHYVAPALGLSHKTHHEARSVQLVHYLAKNYLIPKSIELNRPELALSDLEIEFVCSVILGEPTQGLKPWLFQIVASYQNEIDSDRLVYLARDSKAINYNQTIQTEIITRFSRVIEGDICFCEKILDEIHHVFYLRYLLHKHIYQHHAVCAADLVVRDMMICFGLALRWKEKLEQGPEGFIEITDALVYGLASSCNINGQGLVLQDSTAEECLWMERGKRIARNRLLSRRWYKQIQDVPSGEINNNNNNNSSKIIQKVKKQMGFSYNDINPMDRIYYYKQSNPNVRFLITQEHRSKMISSVFSETVITYYTPPPGDEDIDIAIQKVLNETKEDNLHCEKEEEEKQEEEEKNQKIIIHEIETPQILLSLKEKDELKKLKNNNEREISSSFMSIPKELEEEYSKQGEREEEKDNEENQEEFILEQNNIEQQLINIFRTKRKFEQKEEYETEEHEQEEQKQDLLGQNNSNKRSRLSNMPRPQRISSPSRRGSRYASYAACLKQAMLRSADIRTRADAAAANHRRARSNL